MTDLRVFVCADIEGVSGYVDPEQDQDDRRAVRRAMTDDVNAAIAGVFDVVDDAEVLVADSHGSKRNVLPDELHRRASLVRGGPRQYGMVEGITDAFDVGLLVGAHDKPGSGGHLEHVFTGSLAEVALDDTPVGEVELNALLMDDCGVPVGVVTGDDVLEETVAAVLPAAEYVPTKEARGVAAATCRHPDGVREGIREATATAVRNRGGERPVRVDYELPVSVTVTFANAKLADAATLWPGVGRGDDSRTVRYEAGSIPGAYRFVRATTTLSP